MSTKLTTHCHKLFGLWHWRLKNESGDIIAQSTEGFTTKEACIENASSFEGNVGL